MHQAVTFVQSLGLNFSLTEFYGSIGLGYHSLNEILKSLAKEYILNASLRTSPGRAKS